MSICVLKKSTMHKQHLMLKCVLISPETATHERPINVLWLYNLSEPWPHFLYFVRCHSRYCMYVVCSIPASALPAGNAACGRPMRVLWSRDVRRPCWPHFLCTVSGRLSNGLCRLPGESRVHWYVFCQAVFNDGASKLYSTISLHTDWNGIVNLKLIYLRSRGEILLCDV